MRASFVGPVAVSALVLVTAVPVAAQRPRSGQLYELVRLEAGSFTRATDVNERGQACGLVTEVSGTQAYRWSAVTGVVPLTPAVYASAIAIGITRDGFVLGTSFSPSQSAATVWSPAGAPLALPALGWSASDPIAISDAGVVVGRGYSGGVWQPWVWDAVNGTRLLSSLGFPAGANVTDVNASGVVAGAPFSGEAFLFDLGSATTTYLGTLGGDSSAAIALSEVGSAVGWSQTLPANEAVPFFWSPAGGMRALGSPDGSGNVPGVAADVNRHDVVVGTYDLTPSRGHAFVWAANLGFHDLNALVRGRGGVELENALHISASGWIAGNGVDHSQGDKAVGFLLRPL